MSGTAARTTDGGTTNTNETRHDASTVAERLGGPPRTSRAATRRAKQRPTLVVEPTRPAARESGARTRRPRPRPTLIVKPTPA